MTAPVPPFEELLAGARHTAVHLEMRDTYTPSSPRFVAWLAGHRSNPADDRESWWAPFHSWVADAVARGAQVRRARIISEPITDYIRFEYEVTFSNILAGEQVRWLPRRRASDLALPGNDFWATLHAVESAYVEWRRLEGSGLRRLQIASMPRYEQTRLFRVYQSLVVPGLLQTPGYAAALLGAIAAFRQIPDDVEQAVAARIERQRMLQSGHHRLAVVEEAVLRYQIGDPDVMAAQLAHLITVAALPSVSLGIIPFATAQRPLWAVEGFHAFDDGEVSVELLTAHITVTQPREIAVYLNAFNQLAELAVYGAAARSRITAAINAVDNL